MNVAVCANFAVSFALKEVVIVFVVSASAWTERFHVGGEDGDVYFPLYANVKDPGEETVGWFTAT